MKQCKLCTTLKQSMSKSIDNNAVPTQDKQKKKKNTYANSCLKYDKFCIVVDLQILEIKSDTIDFTKIQGVGNST